MSSRSLGTLTLDLIAKTGGFESGMDKAARIADKRTREIERQAKERAKAIETAFTGMASAIAGPLTAAFSIGALGGMVKGLVDAGDQVQKLSIKTGIAAEELSKLQYAASLSDLSNEDLGASLTKLNRVLGDAASGSKEATAALARFGIAPDAGMTALDALKQIADRVKATGDETKIASGLNDVFGKSFAGVIPLLKGGSEGLKDTGDELERMGGVMSGEFASSSEALNDDLTRLYAQMNAIKLEVVTPLIPLFTEIAESMLDASKKSDGLAGSGQGLKTIFETIAVLGANVAYVFNGVGREIGGIAAQIAALSRGDFKAFSNIGDMMREDAKNARIEVDALSARLLNPQSKPASATAPAGTGGGVGILPPVVTTPKTPKARAKAEDDPLIESAKLYADAMKTLDQAQLKADTSGLNLTATQSELVRVMSDPLFAKMPEEWRAMVAAQAEYTLQAEKVAEEQTRLNELLAATPTEQLEKQRDTMQFLAKAFEAGKISAEQFGEAAQAALGNIPEKVTPITETFLDMTLVANDAANAMADTFTNALFDPMDESIKEMLASFLKAIAKMIAQAMILKAVKAGMTAIGIPFAKGGVFDQGGVQAFASGGVVTRPTPFKFASGGSFKNGLMGEAGPEAILPLKRGSDGKLGVTMNAGGSAGNTVVNIAVNESGESQNSSGTNNDAKEFAAKLKAAVLQVIVTEKRPGGTLWQ